jgi:hypothetical protein
MKIRQVLPTDVDWARLCAGVNDACKGAPVSDKHSFESVKTMVENETVLWFACYEDNEPIADFIVQTTIEDDQRVFNLPIMFGSRMSEWQWVADEFFIAMAQANGCSRIRVMSFKPGIGRFYDKLPLFANWRRIHVFEREL